MSPAKPPRAGGESASRPGAPWSPAQAEAFLRSMDLFGMRFGLDRMRRLMTVLDMPHERFASVHVVGTNGKSSTTRFIAAILQRHGLRTGAYLSPHLISYTERVQIDERDVDPEAFAEAVGRAAWAAERVNRTLGEGDSVTQFELLTAAAYRLLADRGVEVAVIEAGLGGRYDATSVIAAAVTVLTNVGLEHTRWLGPTLADIAREKLAVVSPGTTLVLGSQLDAAIEVYAREVAADLDTRVVRAPAPAGTGVPELHAGGRFQRANFGLAVAAAEAFLQTSGRALDPEAVRDAAAHTLVPGRFQLLTGDPPTVFDGAHNPASFAALAESIPDLREGRPLAAVVGILDDKDGAGMLAALRPHCERLWVTAPDSPRALPPPTLQSLARQVGFTDPQCEPDPARALQAARAWADGQPGGGVVLATGSIYLVGELLRTLRATTEADPR